MLRIFRMKTRKQIIKSEMFHFKSPLLITIIKNLMKSYYYLHMHNSLYQCYSVIRIDSEILVKKAFIQTKFVCIRANMSRNRTTKQRLFAFFMKYLLHTLGITNSETYCRRLCKYCIQFKWNAKKKLYTTWIFLGFVCFCLFIELLL